MAYNLILLKVEHTVFYVAKVSVGSLYFYLVLLLIVLFLAGIYFIVNNYRKNMRYNIVALNSRINLLKEHNEGLLKEQKALFYELSEKKSRLIEIENELKEQIETNRLLEQENKSLRNKNHNSKRNEDIIVEYYINEK